MQHVNARRRQLVWNGLAVAVLLMVMGLSAGANPPRVPVSAAPAATVPAAPVAPQTPTAAEPAPAKPPAPLPAAAEPQNDLLPGFSPNAEGFLAEHRTGLAALAARPPSGVKVPILMYHEIADGPNRLYVTPAEFADQMAALKRLGFSTIRLQDLYDHFTHGSPLPDRPVILTFDDGYASFYTEAYPLLKQHGFTGTLFVITGWVGRTGYVTWDQIRQLVADGVEMGAHTVSHLELPRLSPGDARWEAAESRRRLEREIGRTVPFFAYPAGRNDPRSLTTLKEAGFLGAVTTEYGVAAADQNPLLWKRVRINKGTTGKELETLLRNLLSE